MVADRFSGARQTDFERVTFPERVIIPDHVNPFMPNRFFYLNCSDRSISSKRGIWLGFTITMFYRNS